MGLFFESRSRPSPKLAKAIEDALRAQSPTPAEADQLATRAVQDLAAREPQVARQPGVRTAIKDAYLRPAPSGPDAAKLANEMAAEAAGQEQELMPKWASFVGAAVLFVILLCLTTYVASLADAQPATVTSSQLKDWSSKLIGFDTTLAAVVFGLIGGEAIGQKSPA